MMGGIGLVVLLVVKDVGVEVVMMRMRMRICWSGEMV